MGLLVGTMDIATANNTVAIVMANPIAKEMAQEYGHHTPKDSLHYWILFPVSFRESFHMVHRCLWQFLQSMSWAARTFCFSDYTEAFLSNVSSACIHCHYIKRVTYDAQQVTEIAVILILQKSRNFQKTLDLPPYGSCIKQIQTASVNGFRDCQESKR